MLSNRFRQVVPHLCMGVRRQGQGGTAPSRKCCKVFCALAVTVKTCVLRWRLKGRQHFRKKKCIPELAALEKILQAPMHLCVPLSSSMTGRATADYERDVVYRQLHWAHCCLKTRKRRWALLIAQWPFVLRYATEFGSLREFGAQLHESGWR